MNLNELSKFVMKTIVKSETIASKNIKLIIGKKYIHNMVN
jgi:hypothetical protein